MNGTMVQPTAKYFENTKLLLIKDNTTTITTHGLEMDDLLPMIQHHGYRVAKRMSWVDNGSSIETKLKRI